MDAPLPVLRVNQVRQIYNDGNHNAFTDLCRFRNRFYVAFRSCPDGHGLSVKSRIIILSSTDGHGWTEVHRFGVPCRDVRDPHFLLFNDTLFVYTGTWLVPAGDQEPNLNDHLGYAGWTGDGTTWAGPRSLEGTYGHYIWQAASHGGKAYLCGRRRDQFESVHVGESHPENIQSALLESEDGLIFRLAGLFTEDYGDETTFLFEPDGSIVAIARGAERRPARICRARPPYREWTRTELDRNVGGPLIARWGNRLLVAGRKTTKPNRPCTALYFLVDDRLQEVAELPSGGDNSYPGFVALDEHRGILSYYSSHEGSGTSLAPSAIYLAELSV